MKVYALLLDRCRNGHHDACREQTWTHLRCTCSCHNDAQKDD